MSGEKTEEATPQKQRKAREDGDVSKSAEFTGAMVLTFAAAATFIAGGTICAELMGLMRRMIAAATEHEVITMNLIEGMLSDAAMTYARAVVPVLIAAFAAAGFFTYVQIGALFTIKPLIPDMNKLNPAQGAKNIISKDKLVDLVRNVLKLSLMGVVGYTLVKAAVPDLAMSPRAELELSIGMMLDVVPSNAGFAYARTAVKMSPTASRRGQIVAMVKSPGSTSPSSCAARSSAVCSSSASLTSCCSASATARSSR